MRKSVVVMLAAAFAACADGTMEPTDRAGPDMVGFSATGFVGPCVYFTKDGAAINNSLDCEPNAFGLDVSFGGGAATVKLIGGTLVTPRGITGFRMDIEPSGTARGSLTGLRWMQGSRVINPSVLPGGSAGTDMFNLDVKRFVDVRWVGGGKINIPAGANDLHYAFIPGST